MKEKRPSPVMRLLQWAGPERKWLILSVLCAFGSGILVITSYIGIYRLMDAVLSGACTKAVIADCALLVTAGTVGRLVLLGTSGVLSHKGAYDCGQRHGGKCVFRPRAGVHAGHCIGS